MHSTGQAKAPAAAEALADRRKVEPATEPAGKNTKKSMSHFKYQTTINGTEIAALLIWEVNPYTSPP
jgi:hypothetical protein